MKQRLALAAAMIAILSLPGQVHAQVPGSDTSTEIFRAEALRSDAYEIESSRLALERSRSRSIRAHARRMIRDHEETTRALLPEGTSLSAAGNVVADREDAGFSLVGLLTAPLTVPVNLVGRTLEGRALVDNAPGTPGRRVALDPRRQAKLSELASRRGRDFNATYARQQVQSHEEAVALYAGHAQRGPDVSREFARQVLPALEGHLSMTRQIDDRYAVSEPAF